MKSIISVDEFIVQRLIQNCRQTVHLLIENYMNKSFIHSANVFDLLDIMLKMTDKHPYQRGHSSVM